MWEIANKKSDFSVRFSQYINASTSYNQAQMKDKFSNYFQNTRLMTIYQYLLRKFNSKFEFSVAQILEKRRKY